MRDKLGLVSSGILLPMLMLVLLAASVVLSPIAARGVSGEEAVFCLGFIVLFAFFLARAFKTVGLPEISGYIIAGVLCGPHALNILSFEVVRSLQLFDDVALSIIALIAGGEMRLAFLKSKRGSLASVITGQVLLCFAGAFVVVAVLGGRLPFIAGLGGGGVVAVALTLGLVMAARSPSTTIGVVTETRSKGPFTDLVVGITVILDVVVLLLAALVIPAARTLTIPGETFSLMFARDLFVEILGSLAIGVFLGVVVMSYIRWLGGYLPVFLVGLGFVGSLVCRHYHLDPLLAFMVAGFVVQNFTIAGKALINGLERSALPVYVVFFAISGATIDLGALARMWLFAGVVFLVRAAAFYSGTAFAGGFARDVRPFAGQLWLGMLPQAGVTIGIATVFERAFPWGGELKTIVLAVVAVNQLIGPVALKYILGRTGEAGARDRTDAPS
ncbi:MAG: cation:proton antiporter [bacterium]